MRAFGGLQPLWARRHVCDAADLETQRMRARTADSARAGAFDAHLEIFTPHSCAARPACSAATWAANGVDFLEP